MIMTSDAQELVAIIHPQGHMTLDWEASDEEYSEASQEFQQKLYRNDQDGQDWLLLLGFSDKKLHLSGSLSYLRDIASTFTHQLTQIADLENQREHVTVPLPEHALQRWLSTVPLCVGSEYISATFLKHIWEQLQMRFQQVLTQYDGTVTELIHSYQPDMHIAGRVFFHLVEHSKGDAPFAFLATYASHASGESAARHVPLKHALQEYAQHNDQLLELLSTVYRASAKSTLLPDLIETGEIFHPLGWQPEKAFRFLKEIPLYEASGIICRIPDWWTPKSTEFGVNISLGDKQPAMVGMNAIMQCSVQLEIGGVPITAEEVRALLNETEGLALIKNKWVAVDHAKLQASLEAYEKARSLIKDGMSVREALALHTNIDNSDTEQTIHHGLSFGDWLEDVACKLRDPELITDTPPTDQFHATLRPYQQAGLNWLAFLDALGFGACLADDMGLGKTLQLLAFLSILQKRSVQSLLIVPASLIANWQREIEKFYPSLDYYIAHPGYGHTGLPDKFELVITTYGMVQRDEEIQQHQWEYIILDEAQAIKNPGTRQTQAVKKLHAKNRIILTGTPVENRLGDVWSLFDFVNPGLLGNQREFKAFAKTLKDQPDRHGTLRQVIQPFILRRLKTDKSIIDDLPDKIEMKVFSGLSKQQTVLYHDLLKQLEDILENSEGIQRRGLILSSLTKFKQLCNHPDQYVGSGKFSAEHSGKFQRLTEIAQNIRDKREKMLIFTQFKEMTAPLDSLLAEVFGHKGLILHGSVAVKQRKKLVEQFQDTKDYIPYMVLSLKAGGVGLNLTSANHVVHFDRWWNPAIENQATDRAFRIGQKKNVVVHKFITEGTIEEKIDLMIEEKMKMANDIIKAGDESWITEMWTEDLKNMFRLSL
ncbi:MAG: DEAD/DEAH box helicase [Pseudomonadota bacterium]